MRELLQRSLGPKTTISVDVADSELAAQARRTKPDWAMLNLDINALDANFRAQERQERCPHSLART